MTGLHDIAAAFVFVWRLLLRDRVFAGLVALVIGVGAVMTAASIEPEIVAATIALGCLTILIEWKLTR